ncbi:MAG: putative membrane protein YqiK [Sulfurimonas sp.]|jgi:uncharacterized membrane protein YqiK|uniref:flotillin family protein n=1 Tax=Sulfurimonas sp. TaxID=2022749 RepID=UPI0039E59407
MLVEQMLANLIIPAIIIIALVTIGLIFARLYQRASKEISFVRTGLGGEKVIMNGGALVLPVLHEVIPVNMNTLRLEVKRANEQALITKDRMRVDVLAEFYVRVRPTADSIAQAAQSLGDKTTRIESLKELIEGKFVDSLRAVAAEMEMVELHEMRVDFVQKVQQVVSEDLLKNGLELESVSLTGLDQTNKKYFNPDNAFDAEGLTLLTKEIELRRKKRNDIERDTSIEIERKNLEAEQYSLEIKKEEEYAKLSQEREISIRRAEQSSEIAREEADNQRTAENARIVANQDIKQKEIASERAIEQDRISKEQLIEQKEIEKNQSIAISHQAKDIAISEKSKEQSIAQTQADIARAEAVKAEEQVITVRESEKAQRQKVIELIEASQIAEREAISIKVGAQAEKQAADDTAEAQRTLAQGQADKDRISAEGRAQAEKLEAEAAAIRYNVDAEGKKAINEAANFLSEEQIKMQIKMKLIEFLPKIIEESVRPMEKIESIKIMQVDGITQLNNGAGTTSSSDSVSLPDQLVNSALKFKAQAPIVDTLLNELGLSGSDITSMGSQFTETTTKK